MEKQKPKLNTARFWWRVFRESNVAAVGKVNSTFGLTGVAISLIVGTVLTFRETLDGRGVLDQLRDNWPWLFAPALTTYAIWLLWNVTRRPAVIEHTLILSLQAVESRLRMYQDGPEPSDLVWLHDVWDRLPADNRSEIFRQAAYKQKFSVYGKEMPFHELQQGYRNFCPTTLERDIPWPFWEDATVAEGDKLYLSRAVGQIGTEYTDLRVSMAQFELFLENLNDREST